MKRSSSFPGAALDPTAFESLASRLAAELGSPSRDLAQAHGSRVFASLSSDDQDSESLGEDWSATEDTPSPLRQVFRSELPSLPFCFAQMQTQINMACTQTLCPATSSFAYNMHHKAACIKSTYRIFTSTIASLFRDVGHMPLQRCGRHWP